LPRRGEEDPASGQNHWSAGCRRRPPEIRSSGTEARFGPAVKATGRDRREPRQCWGSVICGVRWAQVGQLGGVKSVSVEEKEKGRPTG
jgi:hypothetical protein